MFWAFIANDDLLRDTAPDITDEINNSSLQLRGHTPLSNTSSDLEDDTEESEFDTEENGGGLSDSSSTTVEMMKINYNNCNNNLYMEVSLLKQYYPTTTQR